MTKRWLWFRNAVTEYLEPVLAKHNFKELTGPGYEPDERKTVQHALSYEDDKGQRLDIDIQKMQLYREGWIKFLLGKTFHFPK
jgi:hypothetical protein